MDTLQQWEKNLNKMNTKLNEMKRSVQPWTFPEGTPRKYETAINHLRIGNTCFTHMFFM